MSNSRVVRPDAPPILKQHGQVWTDELVQAYQQWVQGGSKGKKPRAKARRYGHGQVRKAVGVMYHKLCCYCESRVAVTSYLRVEHYRPKGVEQYMRLAYDWHNLHAACEICNGAKREQFDATTPPVIPTDDDPLEHIRYKAGLPVGMTARGKWTIKYCGIENRAGLFLDQANYCKAYLAELQLVSEMIAELKVTATPPAPRDRVVVEEALAGLVKACQPSSQWSTMVRSEVESQLQLLRSEWAQLSQPATG